MGFPFHVTCGFLLHFSIFFVVYLVFKTIIWGVSFLPLSTWYSVYFLYWCRYVFPWFGRSFLLSWLWRCILCHWPGTLLHPSVSKTLSFHDVPQFLRVPFSCLTSSLSLLWGLIPVLQIWNCLLSSTWLILLIRIPTSLNFLMRFLRFFNYIFISAWVLLSIPIFNWICFSNPGLSSSFHFCFVVVIFFGTIHVFITITSFIELLSTSPLNL